MCHDLESMNQAMEYTYWIQLSDSCLTVFWISLHSGADFRVDKFVDKFTKDSLSITDKSHFSDINCFC